MTTEELDFSRICRICCSEGQMISIFKMHFQRKIMACASVKVWQNDGLPTQICTKCIGKLHIAFQFKKMCEESDARLRRHLSLKSINNKARDNILIKTEQNMCVIEVLQDEANELEENSLVLKPEKEDIEEVYFEAWESPSFTFAENPPENSDKMNSEVKYEVVMDKNLESIECVNATSSLSEHYTNTDSLFQQSEYNIEGGTIKQDTSCDKCGKNFATSTKLNRHMKTHATEMPFRCKFCFKGFTHSGNFKVHLRKHTGERPYQCTMCSHACRQLQDLERHIRTHTGERPYNCKLCDKKFMDASSLSAHSRTHSGEKPYICTFCQKAFSQSSEHKVHLRTHTGEKTHTCNVCNKGFNGSSSLVQHMLSHTDERPFVCNLCNSKFKGVKSLRAHMKRQSSCIPSTQKRERFSCVKCDKSYSRIARLREHMKIHTGDDYPIFL